MKQIQGSVSVKINEYVHAWSELLFVSLRVIFNFFPQINHFNYFTSLHGLQDVENHCAHLRDIKLKTGRNFPYLRFPHVLYNWIEEHENTKLKKKNLLRIQKKGHKNKHKKTWMKWNDTKWTIWYFQQCACVNAIYFAPVITTTYRKKNNKRSTRGLSLKMSVLARVRAQLQNMLYIITHLSVPHGEII